MASEKDKEDGRDEGERRRDDGMNRAARRKQRLILFAKLRFLVAMRASPDRTATTDDAVRDLGKPHLDGGKWCGSVPLSLARQGLIQSAGFVQSARPSRHAGIVRLWEQAAEDETIDRYIANLRRFLSPE